MPTDPLPCGVCRLHADPAAAAELGLHHAGAWLLRHHPHPSPLVGWLLLDTMRHVAGAAEFDAEEAAGFGTMLQRSSALVKELTGCDRVYAIAFGEGARHFHLHLIPRHAAEPASESWRIADLYRAVAAGEAAPAPQVAVAAFVARGRRHCSSW
jgi:diadenosine tetraphosphate (Ap4A) HIT family hydrolase